MGAYVFHHAVVQHDDHIRILHGGDPLGDDELGGAGNFLPERLTDHGVGTGVHGGGGVVQNEDLGLFQQRTGDAKTLLLTAGDVGAALLNVCLLYTSDAADEL